MAQQTVKVHGLRELNKAFRDMDAALHTQMRAELIDVAEPVRETAQSLAWGIRNQTDPWSQFRIGATQRLVYIAPKRRGRKKGPGRRTNFAQLLAGRAMEPALEQNHSQIVHRLDGWLGRIAAREGF